MEETQAYNFFVGYGEAQETPSVDLVHVFWGFLEPLISFFVVFEVCFAMLSSSGK
jgi:hypothetical protein